MPKLWQSRSISVLQGEVLTYGCRKLMKRLEELAHDSSALKAHLVPQLEALCNIVSEMVNFGIQVSILTTCPSFNPVEISYSLPNKRCRTSMKFAPPNPLSNLARCYHLSTTSPHQRWQRSAKTLHLHGHLLLRLFPNSLHKQTRYPPKQWTMKAS